MEHVTVPVEVALRSTRAYIVARVGREHVGYAGLMMTLDDGHVTTIAVDPTWHETRSAPGCCCGSRTKAIERGAKSLTLEVRITNNAAQDLYKKFGFVPVGVRKNYYPEVNEDAIVMWAHDVDEPAYAELLDSIERQLHADADPRARDVVRRDRGGGRRGRPHRVLVGGVEPGYLHSTRFGGVVPEVAGRAHVELITEVIAEALVESGVEIPELGAVAACHGPGLRARCSVRC